MVSGKTGKSQGILLFWNSQGICYFQVRKKSEVAEVKIEIVLLRTEKNLGS
jgi:hypothetical protein